MSDAPNVDKPTPPPTPAPAGPSEFLVSSAPHLASGATTKRIMFEVVAAMLPLLAVAIYMYGFSAIVLTVMSVVGCLAAEALGNKIRGQSLASLGDGSAVVTGMILAFSLPPAMATGSKFYMAFVGGVIAIALGKAVFGGLGNNLFNPAMVGRAFLMMCFPAAMACWTPTIPMLSDAKAELAESKGVAVAELAQEDVDAITAPTPLYEASQLRAAVKKAEAEPAKRDKHLAAADKIKEHMPNFTRLLIGNVAGSVGETSALLALICGLWLVVRRVADWRQPLALLSVVVVISLLTNLIAPDRFQGPLYHLTSGAMMFGAFFIATDYVGAPVNPKGRLIFGAGVGLLAMVIRLFGVYPEGFMFAILIMNSLTPIIERLTTPTPFGGHVQA